MLWPQQVGAPSELAHLAARRVLPGV